MRRSLNHIVVAAFLLAIGAPLVANLAGMDGADAAENRTQAVFPSLTLSWSSIQKFAPGIDGWFQDHFGFRSDLVRWYGESRYFGLRTSPSPLVIRGKEGWLFYKEDGGLQDFTNDPELPAAQVENWRQTVLRARDWCRARGIAYAFTIAPDKHVIYPEYFNESVQPVRKVSRTDQLLRALADSGVAVDLRPSLLAAKAAERVYHVTDTHWNERGAYVAYGALIEAVRRQTPDVPPARDRSTFEASSRFRDGFDLAGMIGLKSVLREEDLRLLPKSGRGYQVVLPVGGWATDGVAQVVTEIRGSSLPRLVMFRDSFTSGLAPFISEHFRRAAYFWQNEFSTDLIEREGADVVIQEIVSRHLYTYIPSPELIPNP
jgi:hypothetical protein